MPNKAPTWEDTIEDTPSWDDTVEEEPAQPELSAPSSLVAPSPDGLQMPVLDDSLLPQHNPNYINRFGVPLEPPVPDPTWGTGFREELKQNAGDELRGGLGFIPSTMRAAGVVASDPWAALVNLGRNIVAPVSSNVPPSVSQAIPEQHPAYQMGERVEAGLSELFPRREEAGLDTSVREGLGQMASMLATGGTAKAAGLGLRGATLTATTLGGVMEFDDAFKRARQRGDDPDTALSKALRYATVSSLIENRLGAGRVLRQMFPSAAEAAKKLTALGVSKKIVGNFVAGGAEEGSQRFAQNWIVDEKPSMEGVGEEALVGSLVQGTVSLPSAGVGTSGGTAATEAAPPVPPTEPSPTAIDEAAINRGLELRQPSATAEYFGHSYVKDANGNWSQSDGGSVPQGDSSASASKQDRDAARFVSELERRAVYSQPPVPTEPVPPKPVEAPPVPTWPVPPKAEETLTPIQAADLLGRILVTEQDFNALSNEEINDLNIKSPHEAGQIAGLKMTEADERRLQEKYDAANKANLAATMQQAQLSDEGKTQKAQEAGAQAKAEFYKTLFYGGMLMSATKGKWQGTGTNREGFLQRLQESRAKQQPEGGVFSGQEESRIEPTPSPNNVFDMDDGDLADILETQYGQRETSEAALAAGRTGTYTFPTYDAFKTWMDARYGERDLEGMKLAFAEADTKTKIRFIKENKGGAEHLRAWVTHLATGAPLPTTDTPVVRTTPRPGPDGTTPSQAQPPPPARPGQPPPPPRQPTSHRKFDVMALTQLFRQFSSFPTVNERLMRAYGRFVPGTKAVELKARLMWDTKLAERVLGHEIGHFIDLAVQVIGRGKSLVERLRPMYDFRGKMWQSQQLRDEARRLSRQWRGPFKNGDRYRDSANELFADFMSAMFNDPEMVNQKYPTLFDAFQEIRDSKPQFKSAYREVETWLQGDTMAQEFIDQQQQSVKRTIDELEKPSKPSKASLWDRLKFGTMSLWGRARQKEGHPKELGSAITDELEYNQTYAAKENALMADDFTKTVTPELARVDDDPIKSRANLSAFSQALRTIGERRAAGVWIEQNPVEARAILEKLMTLDPTLRSKWGTVLTNAQNSELYDVSAAIFREIHDRGEKYVNRIIREIDNLNLGLDGESAMVAFNVRGKLLNPGGLTVENSQKVIDTLREKLGPDRFAALERAAKNLRQIMFSVQDKMHNEGLISDKMWNELIAPNQDNYIPYAVLDYFDGKVSAGVMTQKGTAKDIADVAAATQLKVAASNVWRQKQRQVKLLMEIYAKGGVTITPGEKLKRASDIDKVRQQHQDDDVSRAAFWVDGTPHVVEFPGDPGKLLQSAMDNPAFYEHIGWITESSDFTHRVMQLYTQFSIPFLFWRNPVRGARTAALGTGFGRVAQQMTPVQLSRNMKLAGNYAAAAFGAPMLPEVRDLVDRQILLPPRLSQAMVRDAASLRQMLENHMVLANQVRQANVGKPSWWKGGGVGRQGVILSEKLFSGYEAFEKIYNYYAAIEKGLSPSKAGAIARRRGIPKPGVGGKWSMAMEVWFPWTRVHLQGMRATYDIFRDPKLGKGFATRFALTEALPRVAKVAIGSGVIAGIIKWAIRDDEDDDDGVMAEFLRRVSPYKMALDDTAPLYFYDPRTGKVHYLWEYKRGKDIPKHFEAVSFRIPASEEGRLFGTLLYQMMSAAPGAHEKLGQPGKGFVESAGSWAVNYLGPGLSPIIETTSSLKDMLLLGKNPEDPYRGQPSANPQMFDAGGVDRAQAIAGYVLNKLGSPGELAGVMAANFGIMDERALKTMSRRLPTDYKTWNDRIPFLKSAVAHDNYGQYREEMMSKLEEDKLRARARLLIPTEARSLYDFYYKNLSRKDKLTNIESEQFEVASDFVNNVWGKLTVDGEPNPDSFYSKAAHAAGKDGSKQSRETFQRDLNSAAAPNIAEFMRLNRTPYSPPE